MKDLREAAKGKDAELLAAVNSIVVDWGGIRKRFSTHELPGMRASLAALGESASSETVEWANLYEGRIASVSKVYEMYDLSYWTIYDSRVSKALQCLVQGWWDVSRYDAGENLLRFPLAPAQGDAVKKLVGFPERTSPDQYKLAFVYASWLAKAIAERLEVDSTVEQPGEPWYPFHVEMVMFTLGGLWRHVQTTPLTKAP